jgi:CheY-like chemotaxis protein
MQSHLLEQVLPTVESQAAVVDPPQSILIVDDDEALVEVLKRRLKQQGYQTRTAESGAEALAAARSDRPSLIVLDLRLPDMDGFTVCSQLVDHPETCDIPVIILSGMERPDIIRQSRAAGCQYFVRKPYDPNALLILIRQAIDESGRWE